MKGWAGIFELVQVAFVEGYWREKAKLDADAADTSRTIVR